MNRNPDPNDSEALTEEANEARAKLMRTVEAIDEKAHDALNVRLQVKRHLRELVTAAVVLGIAAAGAIAFVTYRIATRDQRKRRERFLMFRRVWRHPERTARGDATTFWSRLGRSIALTVLTAAIGKPLRLAVTRMLPPPGERTRVAG